jgi:cell division protein FtsB
MNKVSLVKVGYGIAVALAAFYAMFAVRGPNGFSALMNKQQQIRHLEKTNADLAREIEARRERISRLKEDQTEQELEIRQRLKLVRPGERVFILQDHIQNTTASGAESPVSSGHTK